MAGVQTWNHKMAGVQTWNHKLSFTPTHGSTAQFIARWCAAVLDLPNEDI
jgi:hypothetical protein